MKLTFLGTGTSVGVPTIGCKCRVCTSTDAHDKRLRASALVESGDTRILIDCGPDFRQQMLGLDFKRIDAVLLTHVHYDHVGGLDDLRPFCVFGVTGCFFADFQVNKKGLAGAEKPIHSWARVVTDTAIRQTQSEQTQCVCAK